MARTGDAAEGLGSSELKRMLAQAMLGNAKELSFWLARFGGQPGPRPNLALLQGFGAEAASHGDRALGVLSLFAKNDAAPDTSEVFLPMVAAHGYAHLIIRDKAKRPSWDALFELAADERIQVRLATVAALIEVCAKKTSDVLVTEAEGWILNEERELRWGALSVLCDVFAERRVIDSLVDRARWLTFLAALLDDVADAPRAAERSDARRRMTAAMPAPIALVAQSFRGEPSGISWLEDQCRRATAVDMRSVLDHAITRLKKRGGSEKVETLEGLNAALKSSAKPPRDPSRIREGTGRGKRRQSRGG